MQYLFVYGTLRMGAVSPMRHELMQNTRFHADASVQGRLYDVAGYPGLILSQQTTERVYGEVFHIDDPDSLLRRLDEYEECSDRFAHPHEYLRTQLTVCLTGGDRLVAWGYVYNHPVSLLQHIAGGDYIAYMTGARGYHSGADRD